MPLRWSRSPAKKFLKRSPINTLDGDLGADEMCMNDASHPSGSHCLRQRNDTNSWQKEQLCVLIDHTTSSTQLVLSYQDVLSLLMCIKSLPPTKQLERGVLCKVTSTDLIFIELVVTHWFVLQLPGHSQHEWRNMRTISHVSARAQCSTHLGNVDESDAVFQFHHETLWSIVKSSNNRPEAHRYWLAAKHTATFSS